MASRRRLRNFAPAPGRAAVIAAAVTEPERKPAARKDRRNWCRGREGVPHQPATVLVSPPVFRPGREYRCEWGSWFLGGEVAWSCHHQEHCALCGKVLRLSLRYGECPDWPGSEEQKAAAELDAAESAERWREWQRQRRQREPVIDGPQSYRRRRSS